MAIIAIAVVIPLASIAVYGTNSNQQITIADNPKLKIISSFNILHEFSQEIGQEKIDASSLVPVGVEPHDWEPTIKDVQELQKADLIVINGIGFEHWVDSLNENNYQGIIIDTSIGILDKVHDEKSDHDDLMDSHIWLNPVYAKIQVQNIASAFSNSDPENGEFYHANAEKYVEKLDLLDSRIRSELSGCSHDFVSFHNAFSYFADEYDLNQHTIIASNDSHGEVTARTLENVISTSEKLNIKVIFSEENASTKTSEIIANEIGGRVLILSPLEIASDGTYISKMTENLENLKEALC